MRSKQDVRAEHKKACEEIESLMRKGEDAGCQGPLPKDMNQYHQLSTIKETLEWVCADLIKTVAKRGDAHYLSELMGHRFYAMGPVGATMTWARG
jgi:hypothetical protein